VSETPALVSVVPLLWCDKPREVIAWLEEAFGFEPVMVVDDGKGGVIHSELRFGNGAVYIVGPSTVGSGGTTPSQVGGRNTQSVCINIAEGLDALCARARAAGARIQREPADQPYGARVFTCLDPEGHPWAFSQPVTAMSAEQMAEATGHRIETKAGLHG
jgi:uncharacterized glyoxalase superfamily protein PhnB